MCKWSLRYFAVSALFCKSFFGLNAACLLHSGCSYLGWDVSDKYNVVIPIPCQIV